jgi:hypothetical protein
MSAAAFSLLGGVHAVSALAHAPEGDGIPACVFVGAGRDIAVRLGDTLAEAACVRLNVPGGCLVHRIAAARVGRRHELLACAHQFVVVVDISWVEAPPSGGARTLGVGVGVGVEAALHAAVAAAAPIDVGDWVLDGALSVIGALRVAFLALAHGGFAVIRVGGRGHGECLARTRSEGDLGTLFCARLNMGAAAGAGCGGDVNVAVGSFRGVIELWRVCVSAAGAAGSGETCTAAASAVAVLSGHKGLVTALRWARDGQSLLSVSEDRTVRLWSAHEAGVRTDLGALARACCGDGPNTGDVGTRKWALIWTAFAHTGRVWDAVFMQS